MAEAFGIASGITKGMASGVSSATSSVSPTLSFKPLGLRAKNTIISTESDGINTYGLYRTRHMCANNGSGDQWKLVYANRKSEAAASNSITVSAAIEYPLGSVHSCSFGGLSSVTIAVGAADATCDTLTLAIPAGAIFYVRTLVSVASAGMKWPTMDRLSTASANNEAATLGTGALPSISGAITNSSSVTAYCPVAILGRTTYPYAVAIIGDSIGAGATDDYTRIDIGYLARGLGNNFPTLVLAESGSQISSYAAAGSGWIQNNTRRLALMAQSGITHAIIEFGVNDVTNGIAIDGIKLAYRTLVEQLRDLGIKVIVSAPTSVASSTDSWATAANQTVASGHTVGSRINQIYTYAQTLSGVVGYFDATPGCRDALTNKWLVNGNPFAYTADGTHPSGTAHAAMSAYVDTSFITGTITPASTAANAAAVLATANALFDARSLVLSDAANVTSWTDSNSGLVAAEVTLPPIYKATVTPASGPAVRFASASNQRLSVPANAAINNLFANGGYMIIAARAASAGGGSFGRLFSKSASTRFSIGLTTALRGFGVTLATTSPGFSMGPAPTAGAAAWEVTEIFYDPINSPGAVRYRINGVFDIVAATASGAPTDDTASTLVLGNSNAFDRAWDGDIMLIGMWKTQPNFVDRDTAYNGVRTITGV